MLTRRSLLKALALLPFCPQSIKTLSVEPKSKVMIYQGQGDWLELDVQVYEKNLTRYIALQGYCTRVIIVTPLKSWSESIHVVKEDNGN